VESQFDTAVVAAFEAILTAATEGYRLGADPEFVLTHDATSEFTPELTWELNEELRLGVARVAAIAT
jgi:hypothetical protein